MYIRNVTSNHHLYTLNYLLQVNIKIQHFLSQKLDWWLVSASHYLLPTIFLSLHTFQCRTVKLEEINILPY